LVVGTAIARHVAIDLGLKLGLGDGLTVDLGRNLIFRDAALARKGDDAQRNS